MHLPFGKLLLGQERTFIQNQLKIIIDITVNSLPWINWSACPQSLLIGCDYYVFMSSFNVFLSDFSINVGIPFTGRFSHCYSAVCSLCATFRGCVRVFDLFCRLTSLVFYGSTRANNSVHNCKQRCIYNFNLPSGWSSHWNVLMFYKISRHIMLSSCFGESNITITV